MGVVLERRLRERLSNHPNVGNIRGRGLAWAVSLSPNHLYAHSHSPQIELVADRDSKEPFPVSQKVAPSIHAAGLQKFDIALLPGGGVANGIDGDLVVVTPSYNISEDDISFIVDRAARAIEHVLGPAGVKPRL